MAVDSQIVFYDIASGPPVTCYAPNPWKTRYVLNFKGVEYRTEWVELLEVTATRKKLGVAPSRTYPDGRPFYTLPIIKDLSTDQFVGDSFDIAIYLDKQYPGERQLFPASTLALTKAFGTQVDDLFGKVGALYGNGLPLNPATAAETRANAAKQWGTGLDWDSLQPSAEDRVKLLESLQTAMGDLVKSYRMTDGPFLEGEYPIYADFLLGGWLKFVSIVLPEWNQIEQWHDGLWSKLHQALEKYATVK